MLLNHQRELVFQHVDGQPSLCPLCEKELIKKRGERVRWHWAHRAVARGRTACPFTESDWHLAWKDAYLTKPDWKIEWPVTVDGQKYILDAVNEKTGLVREFVHSLSPYYRSKNIALLTRFRDVRWTFDAATFESLRAKPCRNGGGIKNFLKPQALEVANQLGMVAVEKDHVLYKQWKDNVWFPVRSATAEYVTEQHRLAIEARVEREAREVWETALAEFEDNYGNS